MTAATTIAALRAQVDELNARVREVAGAQGRFVGHLAHELKTPLANVLIQTDLLLRSTGDPVAVAAHARSIADDMRHLGGLIDGFLRLAHPFAQEDTSQHVPVWLHDVVVEVVGRTQSAARTQGVRVVVSLADDDTAGGDVQMIGDPVLLATMLENLVRNAIRFSRAGDQVELTVKTGAGSIRLLVRDHGPGIPVANLESVFDWFFHVPGRNAPAAGSGFGLAIVRRVAEHHRGWVAARNHPAGGCEFEVSLPRCSSPDQT